MIVSISSQAKIKENKIAPFLKENRLPRLWGPRMEPEGIWPSLLTKGNQGRIAPVLLWSCARPLLKLREDTNFVEETALLHLLSDRKRGKREGKEEKEKRKQKRTEVERRGREMLMRGRERCEKSQTQGQEGKKEEEKEERKETERELCF